MCEPTSIHSSSQVVSIVQSDIKYSRDCEAQQRECTCVCFLLSIDFHPVWHGTLVYYGWSTGVLWDFEEHHLLRDQLRDLSPLTAAECAFCQWSKN